jgi:hypothetical protein
MRDLSPHFVVYFAALDQLSTQAVLFLALALDQLRCLFNHKNTHSGEVITAIIPTMTTSPASAPTRLVSVGRRVIVIWSALVSR